jgi:DNA-binding Lrp family transcriptional regulator
MLKKHGCYTCIMPSAIVLVNANFGSDELVASRLKKIHGVIRVYRVSGVYDIVALVQTDAISELKTIITGKIRKIDEIRSCITMMIARSDSAGIAA